MNYPTLYRTTKIDGLSIFCRGDRSATRAGIASASRTSVIVAHVRAALRQAVRSLSSGRARLPRLRTQRLAGPEGAFAYTFDRYAEIVNRFSGALGLRRYTL